MKAKPPTSHESPLHVLLCALLQQQLVLQLPLQVLNLLPARHQPHRMFGPSPWLLASASGLHAMHAPLSNACSCHGLWLQDLPLPTEDTP
jgi:hypothetical protein